jgi:uncharacterized protein YjbI with pentapeptide repeats
MLKFQILRGRTIVNQGAVDRNLTIDGFDWSDMDLSETRLRVVESAARLRPDRALRLAQITLRGSLQGANLRGAIWPRVDFRGVNAGGADFSGADLRWGTIDGGLWNEALLRSVTFTGGTITGGVKMISTRFDDADLRDVPFRDSYLRSAEFAGADLRGALFINCNLRHAGFDGANVDRAQMVGCDTTHGAPDSVIDRMKMAGRV